MHFEYGQGYELKSQILNETRPYYVHLPAKYDTSQSYDVMYVLDAECFFPLMATLPSFAFGDNGWGGCIVVGIPNVNRMMDLTPTPFESERGHTTLDNTGGAQAFLDFIEKELKPALNARFSISKRSLLMTHSLGALFGAFALITSPNSFSNYIILEPSWWWDEFNLLSSAADVLASAKLTKGMRVFFGYAGKASIVEKEIYLQFQKALKSKGALIGEMSYPKESHNTMVVAAVYDGLRFIGNSKEAMRFMKVLK